MSTGMFAGVWLVVMVAAPVAFVVFLVVVACNAAKAGDEQLQQELVRRRALVEARRMAVAQAAVAETELMGKCGRDLERAMLNHSYAVAAVQRIDALLEGDEEHAQFIEEAQQELVDALRTVESRPKPAHAWHRVASPEMVSNARWN